MKYIIAVMLFSTAFSAYSQTNNIQFQHDKTWAEIVAQAQKEQKMIMLDCYTTWCGPCQKMSRNIFTNDTVFNYYNTNFINAKFDMEKGEGIELAKRFEIMAYPSFLFFDSNGNVLHKKLGYMNAQAFVAEGKNAQNPDMQLYTLKQKYADFTARKIELSDAKTFLYNLSTTAANANDNMTSAYVESYLSMLNDAQLREKENQIYIKEYVNNADSKGFASMMKNVEDYYRLFDKSEINMKIEEVLSAKAVDLAKQNPANGEQALKQYCENTLGNNAEKLYDKALISFYSGAKNWDKYAQTAIQYIKKYNIRESEYLNAIGWRFFQKVDKKEHLAEAVKFVQTGIENNSNYAILDTYAWLLYKKGDYKSAKKAAQQAIELAKKENEDYSETEKIFQKIKEKK